MPRRRDVWAKGRVSGAVKADSATPGRTAEASGPVSGWYYLAARAHGASGLGEAHYQVMRALEAELSGSGQSLVIVTGHHPVVLASAHGGFARGIIRPAFQALFGAQRKLGKSICMHGGPQPRIFHGEAGRLRCRA